MRPKILFVVNVDWFFLSHRLPLALAAQSAGFEVHIACQFTARGQDITNYNFVLHELTLERSGTSLRTEARTFFSINSLIKKIKPDLIHAVTIKPVLYSCIASRFKNIGRVASISGLGFIFIAEGIKASLIRFMVSFLYKIALKRKHTKVIFQNPTDRDLFTRQGIIPDADAVIIRGSGVDLTKYQITDEPEGIPVVVLLARLLVDKGVLEFVEAARELKLKNTHCRMVLVGDIDENPKSVTMHQIEQWVSEGYIEYWGYTEDVNKTYSQANVVVLPSYREGLPKSLIEAAACGRAVITTDVPGCRDAIVANETGLLVPVKNASALADAIEKLCVDKELRRQFGVSGRHLAENVFDIRAVVQQHIQLYNGLLER
jgi:glycosyltransferase involved in cell wall biosynthesis